MSPKVNIFEEQTHFDVCVQEYTLKMNPNHFIDLSHSQE